MALVEQQPYNLFATPQLTKPVEVYDPNKGWRGAPSANNIKTAFNTPQAQMQIQQQQQPQVQEQPQENKVTPVQPQITSMDDLVNAMYTSPQEEERMRRASVANQRILAVGDALRHIGNIANTINYAPAQQLNSPVLEEEARYKQGKALRDKANLTYLNYQRAKAAQDAKARQWAADQERRANEFNTTLHFNAAKAAADLAEKQRQYDSNLAFNKKKHDDQVAHNKDVLKETGRHHRATEGTARAGLAETIRHHKYIESNGGSGSNSSFPIKSPYGRMIVPGKSIPQAQLNQTYKDFEDAGWISRNEFQKRMRELGIGANADPDYVRNRIVEEVIASNGEASDYMRDNFGWMYEDDARANGMYIRPAESQPQSPYLGYTPDWRGGRSLGTGIGIKTNSNSGMKLGLGL